MNDSDQRVQHSTGWLMECPNGSNRPMASMSMSTNASQGSVVGGREQEGWLKLNMLDAYCLQRFMHMQ